MARKKNNNIHQGSLFQSQVPKMPEGYYSGDKPNPNLKAFVEQHIKEQSYDPEIDDYSIDAFSERINAQREYTIFNMHAYWSKKPYDAIKAYIEHYTLPGDLVLDPFCGSGGTALSALLLNRKAIAIDRSPAALFITDGFCTSTDLKNLQVEYKRVLEDVTSRISDLYSSICHICGNSATIHYQVYSMVFQCLKCMKQIPVFRCKTNTLDNISSNSFLCPYCENTIKTSQEKKGYQLIETWIYCNNNCNGRRSIKRSFDDSNLSYKEIFNNVDIQQLNKLESSTIPEWAPKQIFPEKTRSHTLRSRGVYNMRDLYTIRNFLALCILKESISKIKNPHIWRKLFFAFTAICLKTSKMMGYNADKIGRIRKDSLQAQFTFKDVNVLDFFKESYKDIIQGYTSINSKLPQHPKLIISNQSATDLSSIPSNSIDYIFTDPPYGDKVQFWEMNQVWEYWLNSDNNWEKDEIIVCIPRGITEDIWYRKILKAFEEAYRVLKPGHWMTLTYHDISTGTWHLIQDAASKIGLIPDSTENAVFIETKQKAEKQYRSDININKRDLVINFRKPKPCEIGNKISITGTEDNTTFNEKLYAIIREYLESNPGTTKDRIYDEVVSHMVRAGQMEAHNFDELLRHVAEEVREPKRKDLFENEPRNLFGTHIISRWYLKETELAIVDAAESHKEDHAAEKIATFIAKRLKEHPEDEGVHYSDIFEHYVYTIKDKPRRPLAEWLLDYFYKTEKGTYRLPQSEEEQQIKTDGRAKGTHRHIKRYIAYLQQNIIIPDKERPNDSTLAEWIRHCKRSGLYEQGKLLYEKGGLNLNNLPEELMVNLEEDYQVCVRKLARDGANTEGGKRKKKIRLTKDMSG